MRNSYDGESALNRPMGVAPRAAFYSSPKQSTPAKASGTAECFATLAMTNYGFRLRPIDPTGKSLLIFRNRVKPRNQKYFA
jgi:hypothetical protein